MRCLTRSFGISPVGAIVVGTLSLILLAALWPESGSTNELRRVTLQLKWTHQFQFAGYYAALERGFYRDAGIDVAIVPGGPTTNVVDEVVSGRADFGVGNSSLLIERAMGKPVVAVGVIYQHSPLALLARADRPTDSLHTLAGKKIFLEPHSADLLAMLHLEGVPLDGLTILPHPGNIDGLLRGEADASSTYITDETFVAERAGFRSFIFTPRAYGIDFYGDNLFTREKIARGEPELATRFRDATVRGWEYALANQDELVDLILREYSPGRTREHLLYEAEHSRPLIMDNLIQPGYMRRERWKHIADTYQQLGLLSAPPDLDAFLFDPEPTGLPPWFWPATVGSIVVLALSATLACYFSRINARLRVEMAAHRQAQQRLSEANERLSAQLAEIVLLRDRLHEQAIRDPLTGLYNRRLLDEALGLAIGRARSADLPLSVVAIDVDRFKSINDTWGHPIGDVMLRALAELLMACVRDGDMIFRYGGEELLLLLPNMPLSVAIERAETWRRTVEQLVVPTDAGALQMTVSIGVAAFPEHGEDGESLILAADQALYEAKASGRNCVVALPTGCGVLRSSIVHAPDRPAPVQRMVAGDDRIGRIGADRTEADPPGAAATL